MKKLLLSAALLLSLPAAHIFAQKSCINSGICSVGVNGLINTTFAYNNQNKVLTFSFLASDLHAYQPDKENYFQNQQSYSFPDDYQLPDALSDSLIDTTGRLTSSPTPITFGAPNKLIPTGPNLVIEAGAYPISFDGTTYTVTIDMSQYQNRHANITNVTAGNEPKELSVYPNPATTQLNFSFPASANTTIKLTDMTGRLISWQTVSNTTAATAKTDGFAKGMYLYQVTTDGKTQSGKFIVE